MIQQIYCILHTTQLCKRAYMASVEEPLVRQELDKIERLFSNSPLWDANRVSADLLVCKRKSDGEVVRFNFKTRHVRF